MRLDLHSMTSNVRTAPFQHAASLVQGLPSDSRMIFSTKGSDEGGRGARSGTMLLHFQDTLHPSDPPLNISPILHHHESSGARLTPAGDRHLLTYGDVPAEYEAAQTGCLMLDETTRGAIMVTGADSAEFLHRILANEVRGLEPGHGTAGLLLSSKGKVQFSFDLQPIEDGYLLSTPKGSATDLMTAIDMYLFSDQVTLTEVTEDHAPVAVLGPKAGAIVQSVFGSAAPSEMHVPSTTSLGGRPVTITAMPIAGSMGWRIDGGPEAAVDLWKAFEAAGAQGAGVVVNDILRVEAGRAQFGVDIDDTVYPQEARLEESFSLEKGCYIGQEVVAKIDTYGGLNKRLCALAIDHDNPIKSGTRIYREEGGEWRDLGVATSWAYSFVLDTGLVLAYVKRKHQELGTVFRVGDGPTTATIVDMPVRKSALPLPS
ncbi:MAG: folate-binding protein YgfZ [Planctomycetota bacterium]|jgi:folate-binding protein YgfZ